MPCCIQSSCCSWFFLLQDLTMISKISLKCSEATDCQVPLDGQGTYDNYCTLAKCWQTLPFQVFIAIFSFSKHFPNKRYRFWFIFHRNLPQWIPLTRSQKSLHWAGVGVTKPIFSAPLFSHFFRIIKTVVTCMISSSYLAGVTAAELRRHLANMNMIEIIWLILLLNQNFP